MKGKQIVVGVTGGIAAYKAAELVRLLVKEGAVVRVAMTRHAAHFVGPLTFEALSGNPVILDMFEDEAGTMAHIRWGQEADLCILAPATANLIAKMAHGIADDFLSTLLLASTARILLCPAMNTHMYLHPAVQENLERLRKRGVTILEPGEGPLACGAEGPGRLPDPGTILEEAWGLLSPKDLAGLRILVTAGPTQEPLDPVRYLTNRSSGKMGYAVARAARRRGAEVTLVSGPTAIAPPRGVRVVRVRTALDMEKAVSEASGGCSVIVKAAAVSDYRPLAEAPQKLKKGAERLSLDLVKNPDILKGLGAARDAKGYVLIGFAAETEDLVTHAREKLIGKNLDMIVANDVSRSDAGFQADTNQARLFYRDGATEETPLLSKDGLADLLLDRAKAILEARHDT